MDNNKFRPTYHVSVPKGWCNDPNGMIFYDGKAHLFYQHYPYDYKWGQMHWGHVATKDFVKWEQYPVALRPDEDYEVICGCCSGNAIEKDGKLYLMYTAAQPEVQRQCLAWSTDGGRTFTKEPNNPILKAEDLDPEVSPRDFRDPKIFVRDGMYYCLCGIRLLDVNDSYLTRGMSDTTAVPKEERGILGWGNLILMKSKDLYHWEYCGHLIDRKEGYDESFYHVDGAYECPDFIESNGKQIILASPQNHPQLGYLYQNGHSSCFLPGTLNFENGHFDYEGIYEIDSGLDFYAPQTMKLPDGRIIMIAWKEMWDRSFPTQAFDWAGTYTLPREVEWKNGRLYQYPVREIKNYESNKVEKKDITIENESISFEGIEGNTIELKVVLKPNAKKVGLRIFKGKIHHTDLWYEMDKNLITFSRADSGIPVRGFEDNTDVRVCEIDEEEKLTLDLFLDVNSVEIFINGGRYTMSNNVYPNPDDIGIEVFCEGGSCLIESIEKYDIIVK